MLCLTRKTDEQIVIDGRITITVVRIKGCIVKIGIDAPREMTVHRKEVYDALSAEKRLRDSEQTPGLG